MWKQIKIQNNHIKKNLKKSLTHSYNLMTPFYNFRDFEKNI